MSSSSSRPILERGLNHCLRLSDRLSHLSLPWSASQMIDGIGDCHPICPHAWRASLLSPRSSTKVCLSSSELPARTGVSLSAPTIPERPQSCPCLSCSNLERQLGWYLSVLAAWINRSAACSCAEPLSSLDLPPSYLQVRRLLARSHSCEWGTPEIECRCRVQGPGGLEQGRRVVAVGPPASTENHRDQTRQPANLKSSIHSTPPDTMTSIFVPPADH